MTICVLPFSNLSGVFFGLKYQIPAILASGGGAIVNVSSVFSDRALQRLTLWIGQI